MKITFFGPYFEVMWIVNCVVLLPLTEGWGIWRNSTDTYLYCEN